MQDDEIEAQLMFVVSVFANLRIVTFTLVPGPSWLQDMRRRVSVYLGCYVNWLNILSTSP